MERLIIGDPTSAEVGLTAPLVWQVPAATLALPGSITASGTIQSAIVPTSGLSKLAVSVQSTQAGTLSVQRFVDPAGSIAQGAALTAALTANTLALINNNDGLLYQSLQVSVTNTGVVTATVSDNIVLMGD